jgi:hypothetical protein
MVNKTTLVTGLWDIGRGDLQEGWSRKFETYLDRFSELLESDIDMIIFGDKNLEKFVFERRKKENTQFVLRPLEWFKNNEYYPLIQKIRTDAKWYNQAGWLKDSTQATLEMYNPLVMSKMFLLNDARILDKFDSEYLFWIDAGLTNTVHKGYFTKHRVFDKLKKYVDNFNFICFPYEADKEVHGFEYSAMCKYANSKTDKVARGGFFGGRKELIENANRIYYDLLMDTLKKGYMGTEESLFTLMLYQYPFQFSYSEINSDGLVWKFFEDLKNDFLAVKNKRPTPDTDNVGLYVISFNSPKQFEILIKSMLEYDSDFIDKTKKYLLDNSTELSTTPKYLELCDRYGFEHIKKDNIGITGGRVFVAEHFHNSDLSMYFFFEDDMNFYTKKGEVCRNGFSRYIPNLYKKVMGIMKKENFDFLKLNYTEFYGDNGTQFSWYNVPQSFRQSHWPEHANLPKQGLDPNAPRTILRNINSHYGLSYATGEIYLCNWVAVFTKEGNYKCYLETKFAHPYEQTLMSHCYQETIKGRIKAGVLLLTPTEHHRFDFYDARLRKEC